MKSRNRISLLLLAHVFAGLMLSILLFFFVSPQQEVNAQFSLRNHAQKEMLVQQMIIEENESEGLVRFVQPILYFLSLILFIFEWQKSGWAADITRGFRQRVRLVPIYIAIQRLRN